MPWVCIETHLLSGRFHGCSDERRRVPEWPPSPHRLFQALIVAANLGFRRTEASEAKQEALRWLEQREPPEIAAPPTRACSVMRLYVPNNDMDKVARAWARGRKPEKEPSELRTDKELRPHELEGDATVRFLWRVADDEWKTARPHAELLCEEARHLHALGLGIDLVAGNGRIVSDDDKRALPGEVFVADSEGIGWRVPIAGSLDELFGRYQATLRQRVGTASGRSALRWVAPPAPPTAFREVAYLRRPKPRGRPIHAFALVDEDGAYRSFDPRKAILVAAWLRHAAHERALRLKLDTDFVERFVCGHAESADDKKDRFSYLPLPTIPAKGRDGRIRRVLLAEPFGGGVAKAVAVARKLGGVSLVEEATGEVMADLRSISALLDDGVTARYLSPSRCWGSVTPVVLPGRDDRRSRKAHGLVLKALTQAGYTTSVTETHVQVEPVFPGADLAWRYRVPAYLRDFPSVHAIITFTEAVPGPVAIGAGRHLGLGVFAALDR